MEKGEIKVFSVNRPRHTFDTRNAVLPLCPILLVGLGSVPLPERKSRAWAPCAGRWQAAALAPLPLYLVKGK